MSAEELGAGYFRFDLPETPDKAEVDRIDEIFRQTQLSRIDDAEVKECFVISKAFWNLYKDCLQNYYELGTSAHPVICCSGEDAEFLQTMLGVFKKATEEKPRSHGPGHADRFLPALVNAHLRSIIPEAQLRVQRYKEAQNKDIGRRLADLSASD